MHLGAEDGEQDFPFQLQAVKSALLIDTAQTWCSATS